jgi:predicted metal-dependent hydrolase
VYRKALPLITDDQVRADVKGFMGQEAVHSRAPSQVLDHLAANGLDASPFTDRIDFLFERLLGHRPLGLRLPAGAARRIDRWWLIERLSIIAAVEHFTAGLGLWILDSPALDHAGADPTMIDLLRWHGAEEVEHRSVAFDLFQHVAGSYARRVIGMLRVVVALTILWTVGTRFLMSADPLQPGKATWRAFFRAGRRRRLPTLRTIIRAVPPFLRRDYHPSGEGSTEDALRYLASSPAAVAAATRSSR